MEALICSSVFICWLLNDSYCLGKEKLQEPSDFLTVKNHNCFWRYFFLFFNNLWLNFSQPPFAELQNNAIIILKELGGLSEIMDKKLV